MQKATIYDALKNIDSTDVNEIVNVVLSADKIIFTGVGKNSFVAGKTAAMFSSLSLPAFHLDPTHMLHGDFGAIGKDDVVITLSKSGNTTELYNAVYYLKHHISHKTLVSINFNEQGKVNKWSDLSVILPEVQEIDPWNKVPTNSILVLQYYLDKVAIKAAVKNGLQQKDFEHNHPGGTIGGIY